MKFDKKNFKALARNVQLEDRSNEILIKLPRNQAPQQVKSKNKNIFSRYLIPALSSIILIVVTSLIFLANNESAITKSKTEKVFATQIVTLVNMVDTSTISPAFLGVQFEDTLDYQSIAEEINNYLFSIEEIVNNDLIYYNVIKVDDAFKMAITYSFGETDYNYEFYYDEERISKKETRITGYIVIDQTRLNIIGKMQSKPNENEISVRIFLNETDYVEVCQEVEHRENEYEFAYYKNGQCIKEHSISYEENNNKKEIELEIFENGNEKELEFEYKNNTFTCEYENDTTHDKVKVEITSDGTSFIYTFKGEHQVKIAKTN